MQVINFNDYRSKAALDQAFGDEWVYIGRAVPEHGFRQSPLGNPFTVEEHSRGEAVNLYRSWLWERIREKDRTVLSTLSRLKDESVLVCWCKPKSCHGDIVIAVWERLRKEHPELLKIGPVHG